MESRRDHAKAGPATGKNATNDRLTLIAAEIPRIYLKFAQSGRD
jgi:hypothetical protein